MEVYFSPSFIRLLNSLPRALQEEVIERIEQFNDPSNHHRLKVHKLKGRLKDRWSFSVNYQIRIVFTYTSRPRRAYLLVIGDHDVYDK